MPQRKWVNFRNFTLVLLYAVFWTPGTHAQERCKTELAKAEQAYSEGFFEKVIALIDTCLSKSGLTTAEQASAYKLLGQAYISRNELRQARIHVQKLLEVAPNYEPNQDQDLQMWIELVKEAKLERERLAQEQKMQEETPVPRKKGSGKKWLWIGAGGAVVAGTAAYFIFRGDDTGQPLPDPPGLPARP